MKLIQSLEAERDTLKARVGELERDMEAWKEEAGTFEEQATDLKAERDRLRETLEWIASQSSCECWNQPGMGSGLQSQWVGCAAHRSPDENEWCLCCAARQAIGKEGGL